MTDPEDQLRRAAAHRAHRVGAYEPDRIALASARRPARVFAAAAAISALVGIGVVLVWAAADDDQTPIVDDPDVEIADPPTTTQPPVTTSLDPVVDEDPLDTTLCGLVGIDRSVPPPDREGAQAWVETVGMVFADSDPTVPSVVADDWDAATAGARALAQAVRDADFDTSAVDLDAPEFARDVEARARLEAWCVEQQPQPSGEISCDSEPWATGDLDGDGRVDTLVSPVTEYTQHEVQLLDRTDVLICNGRGTEHPWSFVGQGWVSAWMQDLDHDGRDEVILFDALQSPFSAMIHVYTDQEHIELLPLALDGADEALRLGYTFDGLNESTGHHADDDEWFGCADLDGSGTEQVVVGTFTHDLDAELVTWELAPLQWEGTVASFGPTIIGSFPLRAADALNADNEMPGRWFCKEDETVEPSLGPAAPVRPDDIVISSATGVRIVRGGEPVGVAYDGEADAAHHDLAGGLVVAVGVDTIAHLPVGAPPELLSEFDPDSREHHSLRDVTEINGVPTVVAVRFVEAGVAGAGDLVLIPLDGSPRTSLPADVFEDSGVRDVEWDGEKLVLLEGGEDDLRARAMDLDGKDVTLTWSEWPEGSVPGRTSLATAGGVVWLVSVRSGGIVDVWGVDDADGSDVAAFDVSLTDESIDDLHVDALGDLLVITTYTGSGEPAVHVLDPATGEADELPVRGVASVG